MRVGRGELTLLDPVAQRDQFQQLATMARELLSDFREVEANFRELDRAMRVQITSWDDGKGISQRNVQVDACFRGRQLLG